MFGASAHEINEAEKEFLAQTIEQLGPYLDLHAAPDYFEFPELNDCEDESEVTIAKGGIFRFNERLIEIETSEVVDDVEGQVSKVYDVTVVQEVAVDSVELVNKTTYSVDWFTNEARWKARFESVDEVYKSSPEGSVFLPNHFMFHAEIFYASNPLEKLETRRERLALEGEVSGSDQDLQYRLTRSRLWYILPLLERLGPDNLVSR